MSNTVNGDQRTQVIYYRDGSMGNIANSGENKTANNFIHTLETNTNAIGQENSSEIVNTSSGETPPPRDSATSVICIDESSNNDPGTNESSANQSHNVVAIDGPSSPIDIADSQPSEQEGQEPGPPQGPAENAPTHGLTQTERTNRLSVNAPASDVVEIDLTMVPTPPRPKRRRVDSDDVCIIESSTTQVKGQQAIAMAELGVDADGANGAVLERLKKSLQCSICLDEPTNMSCTTCGHIFCKDCIVAAVRARSKCPLCMKRLRTSDIHPLYI